MSIQAGLEEYPRVDLQRLFPLESAIPKFAAEFKGSCGGGASVCTQPDAADGLLPAVSTCDEAIFQQPYDPESVHALYAVVGGTHG